MVCLALCFTTITGIGYIFDLGFNADPKVAWAVIAAIPVLLLILTLLIRNIAHKVTTSATLEVHGSGQDTTITLFTSSRIKPNTRRRQWHTSEIACISNKDRHPEDSTPKATFNPLEITLHNDKRIRLLNQLPEEERNWIATVLRDITGLPSHFEITAVQ